MRLAKARAMASECASLLRHYNMTKTELAEAAEIIDALRQSVANSAAALNRIADALESLRFAATA